MANSIGLTSGQPADTSCIALPTIAAMRLLLARPSIAIIQDGSGTFTWLPGSTAAADNRNVIACVSGPAGRYTILEGHPADLQSITRVTANYVVVSTDYLVNCLTNAFTVTLPASPVDGAIYVIKNSNTIVSGNAITLATSGGQTIDGSTPGTLLPLQSATLQYDLVNTNWVVE
jgi:hypothetical protein